ncbi:right-handed parallel beta-helix repeat-containing protein [Frankia sp. Cr2]|uniref:right-handed parallel beta-helix repeat-containing protein n=1 Tax=Frankia sp. Cr2 TaxID=3073932 RepID=UPI002AD2EB5F|nr:right-handed parallel beta-helix repeat-containing protein [Frankia sp. Cr2]
MVSSSSGDLSTVVTSLDNQTFPAGSTFYAGIAGADDGADIRFTLDSKPLTTVNPGIVKVTGLADGKHSLIADTYEPDGDKTRRTHRFRANFKLGGTTAGVQAALSASPDPDQQEGSPPPPVAPAPALDPVAPGTEVKVADVASLIDALNTARPGMTITMADGRYSGKDAKDINAKSKPSGTPTSPGRFNIRVSGTEAAPITLRGSRNAVLDGGGTGGGYALNLLGANYWKLQGFTVTEATKGVVLDDSSHVTIDGLYVHDIGQEGIHLRTFSSYDVVTNCLVENTGVKTASFGEGIYLGSAVSNWGRYTGGKPDTSNYNQVIGNTIRHTGAENIDIKEGTTGGVIQNNSFDAVGMSGSWADSWIDVKGNNYMIIGNRGTVSGPSALQDGFQTHVINTEGVPVGSGEGNVFTDNVADLGGASGVGFWIHNPRTSNNKINCTSNKVSGGSGFASKDVTCVNS